MGGPTIDIGELHGNFILESILPDIVEQAVDSDRDMIEVALAVFMSLGTILQGCGMTPDSLLAAVKASTLSTHDAPEGLQ